jgi:hypothetical protein
LGWEDNGGEGSEEEGAEEEGGAPLVSSSVSEGGGWGG